MHSNRTDRKAAPLPLPTFMLVTTLAMFVLFSAYWAIDVYLLWAEVYLYLPEQLRPVDPDAMFLEGLYIPWSVAYYVQEAFQFVMVSTGKYRCSYSGLTMTPSLCLEIPFRSGGPMSYGAGRGGSTRSSRSSS